MQVACSCSYAHTSFCKHNRFCTRTSLQSLSSTQKRPMQHVHAVLCTAGQAQSNGLTHFFNLTDLCNHAQTPLFSTRNPDCYACLRGGSHSPTFTQTLPCFLSFSLFHPSPALLPTFRIHPGLLQSQPKAPLACSYLCRLSQTQTA